MLRPDEVSHDLDGSTRTRPADRSRLEATTVPGLTILCHPQIERVGERVALTRLASDKDELLSRREPLFAAPGGGSPRPLGDVYLSRRPLRLVPAARPGHLRILAAETSTEVEIAGAAWSAPREISGEELQAGVVLLLAGRVALLLHAMDPSPPADLPAYGLVGESLGITQVREQIRRVADLDVPVLIRGASGTGKELVARALHEGGARRGGPFRAVNMAAVPPSLAAAELFGAARGAFTGAERQRIGYFQQADGGSLFLDEVGETPAEVQALLLRVLETGELQPVGGERSRQVDVRLIAATDSNLEAEIARGQFRAPLLHRLSGFEIAVPALAERRDDFGRLLVHFLTEELARIGDGQRLTQPVDPDRPWLPAPLVARLAAYDWPGNVRQLRNVARELAICSRGRKVLHPGPQTERLLAATTGADGQHAARRRKPSSLSDEELQATLRAHRWKLKPAAAELGISRSSLYACLEASPTLRTAARIAPEELRAAVERTAGDLEAMVDLLEVSKGGIQRRLRELDGVDGG